MDVKSRLALMIFVLLTTAVAFHHEPWRDEADAWLIARDARPTEILHISGYAGTPALWYFIQAPFARAGLPYTTQRYLHLLIAWTAVGLLLARAPFSFSLRLALAFGYFLSFEYAVVARNYSSGILLCFTALAMDRERLRLGAWYGLVIGLAANVSVHFTLIAGAFWVALLWDVPRLRRSCRAWLGIAIGFGGIALATWQLIPPQDGQFTPDIFARFEPFRLRETLAEAFAPRTRGGHWTLVVGTLATGLTIARVWTAPRAALVFVLSSVGLSYVFVFKYASGVHHYGLFFIIVVIALWMAEDTSPSSLNRRQLISQRAFTASMLVVLLPSVYIAAQVWRLELKRDFSEAADMAQFIRETNLNHVRIAAHQPGPGSAVLAFLPRRTFWYPGIGEEGSHMKWNARYRTGSKLSVSEAVTLMKAHCPNWQDPRHPVLLLLNTPLPTEEEGCFRLLYRTSGQPWIVLDEQFYLYAPATFVPRPEGAARDASYAPDVGDACASSRLPKSG